MDTVEAPKQGRLSGKTAIVTGGEGGIGSAIVALFVSQGAQVISIDINEAAPTKSITHTSESAHYLQLNITDEHAVQEKVQNIIDTFGRIDVLVNNAGIIKAGGKSHEASVADFDAIFDVNVKGSWLMTKAVLPHFMENGQGSIINFSSIAGLVGGTSDQALYHATKGAIRAMTKADAITYAPYKIRVNSVHPGSVETDFNREAAMSNPEGLEAHNRKMEAKHPLGRKGKPEEIAYGVLYLASEESSFVTGTELVIDGGYTAW